MYEDAVDDDVTKKTGDEVKGKKTAKKAAAKKVPKKTAKKAVAKKAPEKTTKKAVAKKAPEKTAKKAVAKKAPKKTTKKIDTRLKGAVKDSMVKEAIEEAREDILDAKELARRTGGVQMSLWHAGQAIEKFLRVVSKTAKLDASALWDSRRVYEVIKDLEGAAELEASVDLIVGLVSDSGEGPKPSNRHHMAIAAAERIHVFVLRMLGMDAPEQAGKIPEPIFPKAPGPSATGESGDKGRDGTRDRSRHRGSRRTGRHPRGRSNSYVKVFLICRACGVRIPQTRQTARGRVPCPMCGRAMNRVR